MRRRARRGYVSGSTLTRGATASGGRGR